jgi:AraC family transcriptional regulator
VDWVQRLNAAVDYIEQHLDTDISYDKAAQIACCSTFHFHRMFSYIANVPLSEYIRRRRLTLAAFDLQNSQKVIDVALRYSYASPTAFTRAFRALHGISPSEARSAGAALKAYPRISFTITIKGDAEMNYRIETKDAFRIVGVKAHFAMDIEKSFAEVPKFWQKTIKSGAIPNILALMDGEPAGLLGISTCMNGQDFDYYIAVATRQPLPDGMAEYTVPACTWAIFTCIGPMPDAIQTLQKRIVTEWLPTSGYEYANAPDIEVYGDGNQQADDYRCEVWLPIVKKS